MITIETKTQLEAVLTFRDDEGNVTCGLYHDTQKQTREFYKWEKMDVEEIADLYKKQHKQPIIQGKSIDIKSIAEE